MIDSHAHLYFDSYDDDRDAVFERSRAAGVEHFVVIGIDRPTSEKAARLAEIRPDVSATAGYHPTDVAGLDDRIWSEFVTFVEGFPFKGIGETGLDYYWDKAPRDVQKKWLVAHIDLARRLDLPLIVHCRDAWPDLLDVLERDGGGSRGVMHCFSGGLDEMRRSLDVGFDISFAGPVTYPKSTVLREVARSVPADRMHIETDCPFLPPQGLRGQRNEPAYMTRIVECLATERSTTSEEIRRLTMANSRRLFRIGIADS